MKRRASIVRPFLRSAWLSYALLTVFALRALIPAGYMPDFESAKAGGLKLTICSASGAKSLEVDADGKAFPIGHHKHRDQACAFTGIATIALPTLSVPVDAPATFEVAPFIPKLAVELPPVRAGPAVGSRAPPIFS